MKNLALLSLLVALSGCASSRVVVSNPHRDIYVDVSANGAPVASGLSMGYAEGVVPPGATGVEVRAVTYRLRQGVRSIVDSVVSSLRLEPDSDLRVKVNDDGLINTFSTARR